MIGMPRPSQFIGIASRDHGFLDVIRDHPKAFYRALHGGLLEPVKGDLSHDPDLIEEIVNKEVLFGANSKGIKAYVQLDNKVEMEKFLSYMNR
jgi:hypothetical protein